MIRRHDSDGPAGCVKGHIRFSHKSKRVSLPVEVISTLKSVYANLVLF